jgi:transcriptional regulator with PAS, ATPase and Fis domain
MGAHETRLEVTPIVDVFVTDGTGVTLFVGPTAEAYYGAPPSEMLGKHVQELQEKGFFRPAVTPAVLQAKATIVREQKTRTGHNLLVTGFPILDSGGNVSLVICLSKPLGDETKPMIANIQNSHLETTPDLVFQSRAMQRVLDLACTAAQVDSPVLLLGETGVGKSLVARAIHLLSRRARGPLVTVNCAAIPEPLIEAELFGYAPGAFTGADRHGKQGLFLVADGGTLFLDEISEFSLSAQAKLLQAVENRCCRPVGAHKERFFDTRIIAASNRDLEQATAEGKFRADLYFRISAFTIYIPPLRDRPEDIPVLARYFLAKHNATYGKHKQLSGAALDFLVRHHWPGNIRELDHAIERLVLTVQNDLIDEADVLSHLSSLPACSTTMEKTNLREAKRRLEEHLVRQAYAALGSSYKVARALGISQSAAYYKIKRILGSNPWPPVTN